MSPEEFWHARRLIAEETVGRLVREQQRQSIAKDDAEAEAHRASVEALRRLGLVAQE